uniref:Tetratricopeptide repeat protein 27-like n=1 Tax=Saccoglossus kowalevskii TaxID=10224 RepID=A0ABM0MXX1_SACKO|nr:PREDICTED: tetratricopeptide repeat protein 27-like [Saccoglossus kowalevskii]
MAEFARSLERSLLTHARVSVDIKKGDSALRIGGVAKQLTAIISEAINGEYGKILESENTKQLFGYGRTEQLDVPFQDFLKHNVKIFLNDSELDSEALRQLSVLSTGVACLQLFIQTNWTGPPHSYDPTQQIPLHYQQQGNDFQEYIFNSLCCDEGSIYSLVGKPLYLLIAQTLLIDCRKLLPSCQTVDWWALRCLFVKQRLLDERSPTCHDEIMHLIQQVQTSDLLSSSVQSFTKIQFHLELCYIYGYYYEYQKAKGELTNATKAAELEVTLAGALGKRTKFQHNDIAQLCLQVIKPESKAPIEDSIKLDVDRLPKDLLLNDETLLNKVQYADPEHNKIPNLSGLEQALLLAMCIEHKRVQPKQELLVEELQSYIQVILEQPRVWCIQTVALMMRSLLEDNRRKTVERSMMQLEVLVNQFNNNIPEGPDRLYLFYASNMPARWKIEQNFAKLLISLGAISTALEVYLRLHLWEEAIECYQALGRYEKVCVTIVIYGEKSLNVIRH